MSSTNWTAQGAVWNDGNEVWDLREGNIAFAQAHGFVPQRPYLFKEGPKTVDIPAMPVKIVAR